MKNSRAMQMLVIVFFCGIILSCTACFGLTALIASPNSRQDTPYRSEAQLPDTMNSFDRGFYLDAGLQELLIQIDYRVFGIVAHRSVLAGRDDFLYPLEDVSGYHYLEDFCGGALYSAEELDRISKAIAKRSIAYANQGVDYRLVVIPNSQTIYPENLPGPLAYLRGQTRLEQLSAYLSVHNRDEFLDLTETLCRAKENGLLYNNTENSLNALGAYAVYRAVLDALPAQYAEKFTPIETDEVSIFTRYTPGKALARLAGVPGLVGNKTLSLSNDTVLKYQMLERVAGMELTYVNPGYKDEISNRPALLLEFGGAGEWDKIQMMPYFSNTFGIVAYKSNTVFSLMAVDYVLPAVAVQFIHENELDSLLDETLLLSYNDGLGPGDDPFTAMTPIVLGVAQNSTNSICMIGRCEQGSTVRISGEGIHTAEVLAMGDRFILEVVFDDGVRSADVVLSATVADKTESGVQSLTLTLGSFSGARQVSVGSNSMLFRTMDLPRPYNTTYSLPQIQRISRRLVQNSDHIRALSEKDTVVIHAYLPDKRSIYGDMLPETPFDTGAGQRIAQLAEALASTDAVKIIDLSSPLRRSRSAGLLYRQTDDTLTPRGAFTAYHALFRTLSASDERLTPHSISEYRLQEEEVPGGALVSLLGFEAASVTETMTTFTPDFPVHTRRTTPDGSAAVNEAEALVYRGEDESLPVGIVLRDAFGTAMLPYLAEHFSLLYVLPEGEFSPADDLIRELAPDYIVAISGVYNLPLN